MLVVRNLGSPSITRDAHLHHPVLSLTIRLAQIATSSCIYILRIYRLLKYLSASRCAGKEYTIHGAPRILTPSMFLQQEQYSCRFFWSLPPPFCAHKATGSWPLRWHTRLLEIPKYQLIAVEVPSCRPEEVKASQIDEQESYSGLYPYISFTRSSVESVRAMRHIWARA